MSVIHFSDDELGNVAAALAPRWGDRRESIKRFAALLALVSKANAKTYTARYGDPTDSFPAEMIEAATPGLTEFSLPQALGTVRSLGGNIDLQQCTKPMLAALSEIQHRALDAALS